MHLLIALYHSLYYCFLLTACAIVGPDYVRPELPVYADWVAPLAPELIAQQQDMSRWWTIFEDDELSNLVEIALRENNSTEIAALRVLESRAQ